MKRISALFLGSVASLLYSAVALAGMADVLDVRVDCPAQDRCDFTVTLSHADEGWDHYADRWEVLGPDGTVLGTRTLLHPHVHEQPFTRSLDGVAIPGGTDSVTVRAHDSVHRHGGRDFRLALPSR